MGLNRPNGGWAIICPLMKIFALTPFLYKVSEKSGKPDAVKHVFSTVLNNGKN